MSTFQGSRRVAGEVIPQTEWATRSGIQLVDLGVVTRGPRRTVWPGLTSMRKSPIRSPARHATPPSSTDSRYCSAGKAGVGVNSSMGVCAADGEEPAGSEGRGGEAEQGMGLRPKSQRTHWS